MAECTACDSEVKDLTPVHTWNNEDHQLCFFCGGTLLGNMLIHPKAYGLDGDPLHTMIQGIVQAMNLMREEEASRRDPR